MTENYHSSPGLTKAMIVGLPSFGCNEGSGVLAKAGFPFRKGKVMKTLERRQKSVETGPGVLLPSRPC